METSAQPQDGMLPRFYRVAQVTFPTREEKSNKMRDTFIIIFLCKQPSQGFVQLFFWPWNVSNTCIHNLHLE
jgi:hypothetical protein